MVFLKCFPFWRMCTSNLVTQQESRGCDGQGAKSGGLGVNPDLTDERNGTWDKSAKLSEPSVHSNHLLRLPAFVSCFSSIPSLRMTSRPSTGRWLATK